MKIAMYGGSFNPPHIGHLIVADLVLKSINYDNILFIPAKKHLYKVIESGATYNDRVNMLKLMIKSDNRFLLEEYEINNDRISYSIDTLKYLYSKYDSILDDKIALIIGADLVSTFDKWKCAKDIASISNIVVVNRNNLPIEEEYNFSYYKMKKVNIPNIDISSSFIRNQIKSNSSFRYFLYNDVYNYIVSNDLYK